MENLVPLGTGNSRFMKSNIPASTTLAQLIQMLNNGTFPYDIGPLNSAGISQQGTPLNKATLFSDQTMAKYPSGIEDPNDAFEKLASAAFLEQVQTPIYQEVTVDLSSAQPGDIVRLPESGKLVDFYVGTLNYEQALNGAGRVLMVRKDLNRVQTWNDSAINYWTESVIYDWLNNDYKALLPAELQSAIGTTTYRYSPQGGSTNVSSRSDAIFQLSYSELGLTGNYVNVEGSALPIASTLRIAQFNGIARDQWTRSPANSTFSDAFYVNSVGAGVSKSVSRSAGYRPCFTLPNTFTATYYVDDDGNLHDEQEYSVSGSITDIFGNPVIDLPATQIYTGSYTGTGTGTVTLTLPVEPTLVIAGTNPTSNGNQYLLIMTSKMSGLKACTIELPNNGSNTGQQMRAFLVDVTFNGNSVTYGRSEYGASSNPGILNTSGTAYYYIAI